MFWGGGENHASYQYEYEKNESLRGYKKNWVTIINYAYKCRVSNN
jgi:hypothetical protein